MTQFHVCYVPSGIQRNEKSELTEHLAIVTLA